MVANTVLQSMDVTYTYFIKAMLLSKPKIIVPPRLDWKRKKGYRKACGAHLLQQSYVAYFAFQILRLVFELELLAFAQWSF